MLEEIVETVVEIAVDVAEAVITDKLKKKDSRPCNIETEPEKTVS